MIGDSVLIFLVLLLANIGTQKYFFWLCTVQKNHTCVHPPTFKRDEVKMYHHSKLEASGPLTFSLEYFFTVILETSIQFLRFLWNSHVLWTKDNAYHKMLLYIAIKVTTLNIDKLTFRQQRTTANFQYCIKKKIYNDVEWYQCDNSPLAPLTPTIEQDTTRITPLVISTITTKDNSSIGDLSVEDMWGQTNCTKTPLGPTTPSPLRRNILHVDMVQSFKDNTSIVVKGNKELNESIY